MLDERTIGRVRGAEDNDYTAGVICAKVARYAERIHHPDRLTAAACARAARARASSRRSPGTTRSISSPRNSCAPSSGTAPQAVWPYYYAGTMGLVMRDGINRLRHAKKYSGFHSDHLRQPGLDRLRRRHRADRRPRSARDGEVRPGRDLGHQPGQHPGQRDDARDARPQGARRQDRRGRRLHERHHGAGRSAGADPARHRRRARLRGDALPVPRRQGRLGLSRPLHRRAARARSASAHARPAMGRRASPAVRSRPSRNSPGSSARRKRAYFRLGYGFSRSRNGAVNMHAASCIPAVTGAWLHEGGGAFHNNARDLSLGQDA